MSQLWLLTWCQHLSEKKLYIKNLTTNIKKRKKEREMRNICWSKRLTSFCISLSSMNENVILMFTKLYLYYPNFRFQYTLSFPQFPLNLYLCFIAMFKKSCRLTYVVLTELFSWLIKHFYCDSEYIYCFIAITFVTRWSSINVTVT